MKPSQGPVIGVARRIVGRADIGINDIRIVVSIGNNIGIVDKSEERCKSFESPATAPDSRA
jgi:hypothetical protein